MNKATEKLLALLFLMITGAIEVILIVTIVTGLLIPAYYWLDSPKKEKKERVTESAPASLEDRQDRIIRKLNIEDISA